MTKPREMRRDIADACAALDAVLDALPDLMKGESDE